MSDWPTLLDVPARGVITPGSPQSSVNMVASWAATAAWPSANLAIYTPFVVETPVTIYQIAVLNGGTLNGNLDVGIYDWAGTRLVSSGSTAQTGTSVVQALNITDTLLPPGNYFMAMATNSATATYLRSGVAARVLRVCGVLQQATAFALPSPMTGAAMAQAYVPWMALSLTPTI